MSLACVCALVIAPQFHADAFAQTRQYLPDRDVVYSMVANDQGEAQRIVTIDVKSHETKEIYRPSAEGELFDFGVAARTDYLAARERIRRSEGTRVTFESMTLHIMQPDGTEFEAIENVRDYSWSPDGRYLAYVTGDVATKYSPFRNAVAWVLDAANRRRSKVIDNGYVVRWASFDGRLYIWKYDYETKFRLDEVVAYDASTESLLPTRHQGVLFSSTGSYYFDPGGTMGQGLRVGIYSTASDQAVGSRFLATLGSWRPVGWAPGSDLLLVTGIERQQSRQKGTLPMGRAFIFDPKGDTGVLLSIAADEIIGWGESAGTLVTETSGAISKQVVDALITAPPNR